MDSYDVLVLGAGAVGCSVAAHLLRGRPGLRVLLVDAHHVGAGSTSRSTAAFRHQWSVPAHVSFSRYASAEYARLESQGHPIRFRRNGYLFLYTDRAALAEAADRVERQREMGVEGVRVLTPGQIQGIPGGDAVDDPAVVGATWGPRDGFLDPLAVAQTYLKEAKGAGVLYRPGVTVSGLESVGGAWRVRTGSGETIAAARLAVCCGVWTDALLAPMGLPVPIRPAKRYLYHSRPLREREVATWPLLIGDAGQHLRPSEGNTLMMAWEERPRPRESGRDPVELWRDQDTIDPGFGLGVEDYGMTVLAALARHIPALAEEVALARVTCGWYAVTPDHKAILGEDPRAPGLFHAAGFSGHGIMHAAATGKTLSEVLTGEAPSLISAGELASGFGIGPLLAGELREPVEGMVL